MKIINKQVAWGVVALIAIGLVFFAGSISRANDEYITVKTTITSMFPVMEFSWCDNEHLLVRKTNDELYQQTINTTQTVGPENKLYYIDVTGKTPPRVIDLSPFGTNPNRITLGACKNNEILIRASDDGAKLYSLRIGNQPELLASFTSGALIDQMYKESARYFLSAYRTGVHGTSPKNDNCAVSNLNAEYKLLCWEAWLLHSKQALSNYVLATQQWQDEYIYRDKQENVVKVPNPAGKSPDKALQLKLYDLDQNELANLSHDPVYKASFNVAISPDEKYAYSPCIKKPQNETLLADKVCRYRLDGAKHLWEEVFAFDPSGKYQNVSIQQLNVGPNGDVYFIELGPRNHNYGIWKFEASTKQIKKITSPPPRPDEQPRVSPDGNRIAFVGLRDSAFALLIAQTNK